MITKEEYLIRKNKLDKLAEIPDLSSKLTPENAKKFNEYSRSVREYETNLQKTEAQPIDVKSIISSLDTQSAIDKSLGQKPVKIIQNTMPEKTAYKPTYNKLNEYMLSDEGRLLQAYAKQGKLNEAKRDNNF